MMTHGTDRMDAAVSLFELPPTSRQSRWALAVAVVLIVAFGALAPFARTQLTRLDAFIPSYDATVVVTNLVNAALLFAYCSVYLSRQILALAVGYLFTALIVIPHALAFPGAFSQTGLIGNGFESTAWLYTFFRLGFPSSLLCYVLLGDDKLEKHAVQGHGQFEIISSIVTVIILALGLTWFAAAGNAFIPRLFFENGQIAPLLRYLEISNFLLCVTTLFALWANRRSVLDEWLMVVALAPVLELAFVIALDTRRFTLGFYAGRMFSIVASTIVLTFLVTETTRLYARLARTNMILEREQNNKLMNMQAITAAIAHEVRQPLAGIVASGNAALRFLRMAPPDPERAQVALDRIVSAGHRTSEIFNSIRALFGKGDHGLRLININEIILVALDSMSNEIKDHGVETRCEFTSKLIHVKGHRGQLQEVISNLVLNAIEAMGAMVGRRRVLLVRTELRDGNAISVVVEDSGPGIDPAKLDDVFSAFVTTKSNGMGLGLAICRMIVEHHGGQLRAVSDGRNGASFQFVLPIESIDNLPLTPKATRDPVPVL